MRVFLSVLLLCLFAVAYSSPIHGIWNNLPLAIPAKRVYGLYQHLPMMDSDFDKRNVFFWRPGDFLSQ